MAGKEKSKPEAEAGGKSGGKSKMMLMLIIVIALAAGGGGGGWFYMRSSHASAEANPAPKKVTPPTFVPLDQFTVNLADREHYLQLGVTFEVTGTEISDSMKSFMPILRSKILMLLSSKTAEELIALEGKNTLAEELLTRARETVQVASAEKSIAAVHFSSFVIQ